MYRGGSRKQFVEHLAPSGGETTVFLLYNENNINSIGECFSAPPYYAGLYRPLTTSCYYYLGRKLFDGQIEIYKIINLMFFVGNTILFFLVCRQFLSYVWSLVPVVLFSSRQAHITQLFGTVEFQTVLSVFFLFINGLFFYPEQT